MLPRAVTTSSRLKSYQAGSVELYGETQTAKLIETDIDWMKPSTLGSISYLNCSTFRLTNLSRIIHHNRIPNTLGFRLGVLYTSILSLVSTLLKLGNGITHRETNQCARNQLQLTPVWNYGITYGTTPAVGRICGLLTTASPIGDGTVVVRRQNFGRTVVRNLLVRTFASKAGDSNVATRGSEVEKVHTHSGTTINIKSISNLKNLVLAYETIKSNPGNMTPGLEPTTLDGISKDYLIRVQEKLRAGTFEFKAARRIQIPKPGKSETRPLTIASPREKIVQKAIQLVLEPVFEQIFLDYSHGFRPKKGTRTAIKYLDSQFQSSHYIIEADFSKAFDSIPHNKLMELLKEKIKCEKTLKLIFSGLKAGYAEFGKLHEQGEQGTPQGSILSPLLCNIYLHQLDVYIEKLKNLYDIGDKKMKSTEHTRLTNKAKY